MGMLGWALLLLLCASSSKAVHGAPSNAGSNALACGALGAAIAAPGCPCTIPGGAQAGPLYTPCQAGYRCSSTVLGVLASTSQQYAKVPTQTPQGDTVGVCTPCTLGEQQLTVTVTAAAAAADRDSGSASSSASTNAAATAAANATGTPEAAAAAAAAAAGSYAGGSPPLPHT
jgi:hypothetical protein